MVRGVEMPAIRKNKGERGFTLIEIMVVIAIIGILSLIAILQFSNYKQRSLNSAVETDLKNAATAQEAYFADQNTYCGVIGKLSVSPYGLAVSKGVNLQVVSASTSGYTMLGYHDKSNQTYTLAGPGGSMTY
jgi:type IV pilus assembly protein PilA